jgi:hypothetical protein
LICLRGANVEAGPYVRECLVEGVEWSGYLEVCVERHVVEYLTWDFRGSSP